MALDIAAKYPMPTVLGQSVLQDAATIATVLGALAAVIGALLVRRFFQYQRAMEFIDRFAGPALIKARTETDAWRLKAVPIEQKLSELDWWLSAKSTTSPDTNAASTASSVMIVMDFFEQLAAAYERDLIDRRFTQMVFYFYVRDYWRDLSVVARKWREMDNEPRLFTRFERLDQVMRSGGDLSLLSRCRTASTATTEFIFGGRVKWPSSSTRRDAKNVFIFGYGTLMSFESAKDTMPGLMADDMKPAEIDGFERGWFVRCPVYQDRDAGVGLIERSLFNALNLGIRQEPGKRVNGVLLRVSSEWLATCDRREKQYLRVDVTKDVVGGAPADSVVYAYAVDPHAEPIDAPEAVMVEDVEFLDSTIAGLGAQAEKRFRETTQPLSEDSRRVRGAYKFLDPDQQVAAMGSA